MMRTRVLILGAAGRDFHNFNVVFRSDPAFEVVAFTAQQIPHIAGRRYPHELSGDQYPEGIPIYGEDRLAELVRELEVDVCVLAYSDLAHLEVMHLASRCNASGASFLLLGARQTMLRSMLPVIAVTAVRTGAGKSQVSRAIVQALREAGRKPGILRHPMPYGDLAAQRVQRFASAADLETHDVTVEEREEYEPHIAAGSVVWAGVDYGAILEAAEREADILVWDGGNNDTPFLKPDLHITILDPHRAGHELAYHPGETNVRMADVLIINKVDSARAEEVEQVRQNVAQLNPGATLLEARSPIVVDQPELLAGRRVLCIEDGPTVTHGGMPYGAALLAAQRLDAVVVDPRAYAVGEIAETYACFPALGPVLPAMGYGDQQLSDLQQTIANAAAAGLDAVAIGTPIDLARLIQLPVPATRVRYSLELVGSVTMRDLLQPLLSETR
ncbi:MAG TPA: cyclic 2,3-diphosphoglycerate synthase [Longimicrobiales bacterium]|nr:cyclic 2,3-diphosphoglycerate synthase [Longimicrobiales bacterium]